LPEARPVLNGASGVARGSSSGVSEGTQSGAERGVSETTIPEITPVTPTQLELFKQDSGFLTIETYLRQP